MIEIPKAWRAVGLALLGVAMAGCTATQIGYPTLDCSKPAKVRGGFDYTVVGRTPERLNWSGCDKSGANLAGTYMGTAVLIGTNLSGANLQGTDLGGANLSGANLSAANLRGADLTGIGARKASFAGADFSGATIAAGTFYDADFSGATWSDGVTVCPAGSIGACR